MKIVTRLLRAGGPSLTLYAQDLGSDDTLLPGERAPEIQQGEFVEVFNELTNQWAAWRDATPEKPVHRHFKIVSERDNEGDAGTVCTTLELA